MVWRSLLCATFDHWRGARLTSNKHHITSNFVVVVSVYFLFRLHLLQTDNTHPFSDIRSFAPSPQTIFYFFKFFFVHLFRSFLLQLHFCHRFLIFPCLLEWIYWHAIVVQLVFMSHPFWTEPNIVSKVVQVHAAHRQSHSKKKKNLFFSIDSLFTNFQWTFITSSHIQCTQTFPVSMLCFPLFHFLQFVGIFFPNNSEFLFCYCYYYICESLWRTYYYISIQRNKIFKWKVQLNEN